MHSARLALLLFSPLLACACTPRGPSSPSTSAPASPSKPPITASPEPPNTKTGTPFWLTPVITPGLAPAAVTLTSTPDSKVSFDLLQVGTVDPKTFVVTNPAVVPFVTGTDTGYDIIPSGLNVGALVYSDRKYAIQKLPPALSGLSLLRTRSADKAIMDGRFAIILSSPNPCYVMVALDERAVATYQQYGPPGWLQEFAPTEYKIQTDDPLMAAQNLSFLVFARKAPAGHITLGPPCMDIKFNAMYFAFFAQDKE